MGKIVIYRSSTGFTKHYAEWIAESLGCESVSADKITKKQLKQYDYIIYGGWIMGYHLIGDKNIKPNAIFAVGASNPSAEVENKIIVQSEIDKNIPFAYFQGGFNLQKQGYFKKIIINMLKKSLIKKENKSDGDIEMLKSMETSFDASNRESINYFLEKIIG